MTRTQTIAILGAGSWGTALALHLSRLGQQVRLWSYQSEHIRTMALERMNNRYMPGYLFPDTLQPVADLSKAISGANMILIAVPSFAFRDTLTTLNPLLTTSMSILWATKGLDPKTGQLLHDVLLEVLGEKHRYVILSGPSFAHEVAKALPTAIVAAGTDLTAVKEVVDRFNSPLFRVYSNSDITGVEIGGIVKNVLAIATGISDGMGFGANARSALMTRGLAEMIRLGTALNARQETFMGLAGLGDLILTCTDNQSRNRRFGMALGAGKNPIDAEHEIGQVVEGKRNAECIVELAKQYQVSMPITETVWDILRGHFTLHDAMQYLLEREPREEH